MIEYIDDYPACKKTEATLRIYFDKQHPNFITKLLGIPPTKIQIKNTYEEYKGKIKIPNDLIPLNGWFLESDGYVFSQDSRRHIDYILDKIILKNDNILYFHNLCAQTSKVTLLSGTENVVIH
ncbi:hypothetical protein [Leptospira santarosai]|uniref:hypothetical protein n=1 Tax=Leptospira santarosai TaxID=28183 RepID=UPI0018AD272B|nr:hypothetical protein [Leptospira santarosai]